MNAQQHPMGTKPILPLLISMSLPPIVSMLIQSLYNIVDSIFVAQLSENALTAVSLAFPLQNIVLSVAVGLGVAINAIIARSLGAQDIKAANQVAMHGFLLTGIHSILFVFVGLFLTQPFLRMFTQDAEIFEMACQYSYLVICFSFGSLFHILIEKIFQASGNMVIPMVLQGVGALINIILDPIFIFGLLGLPKMGVVGAALATLIGQFSACGLAFFYFFRSKGPVSICWKDFRFRSGLVGQLYSIGIPSGMIIALPSVLVSILNILLSSFSQTAVAVFGIYFKLQTFIYLPVSGLVQGMRPLISFNYGAGKPQRMDKTLLYSLVISGGILAFGWALFSLLPEQIMFLFQAKGEMLSLGITSLRIISSGFLFSTIGVVLAGALEALGKGGRSLIISIIRQLIVIPPVAWFLSQWMDINGIWAAFPIAELLAAIVAVLLYWNTRKHLYFAQTSSDLQ